MEIREVEAVSLRDALSRKEQELIVTKQVRQTPLLQQSESRDDVLIKEEYLQAQLQNSHLMSEMRKYESSQQTPKPVMSGRIS